MCKLLRGAVSSNRFACTVFARHLATFQHGVAAAASTGIAGGTSQVPPVPMIELRALLPPPPRGPMGNGQQGIANVE